MSGVLVVGMVMGMSTVAQMPLPFPCLLLPSMTSESQRFLSSNPPTRTRSLRHLSEQDSMSGNDYESTFISSSDQVFTLAVYTGIKLAV